MLTFKDSRDGAKKKLATADHMLTQTYPLVNDPKLLLGIVKNIDEAIKEAILAMLLYEASMKRISKVPEDFQQQLSLFKREVVRRYGLPDSLVEFVRELGEILLEHKHSPVEFARKDKFVICDEHYNVKMLTQNSLKKHLSKAKIFIKYVEQKVNRNDAKLA